MVVREHPVVLRTLRDRVSNHKRFLPPFASFNAKLRWPRLRHRPFERSLPHFRATHRQRRASLSLGTSCVEKRGGERFLQPLDRAPGTHSGGEFLGERRRTRTNVSLGLNHGSSPTS